MKINLEWKERKSDMEICSATFKIKLSDMGERRRERSFESRQNAFYIDIAIISCLSLNDLGG